MVEIDLGVMLGLCDRMTASQRERPVAYGQRTHGLRRQADIQFSSRRWSWWQLCSVMPTAVSLADPIRPAVLKFEYPGAPSRRGKPAG